MNEKIEAWLNGFLSAFSFSTVRMNYYWSSAEHGWTVEFFGKPTDEKFSFSFSDETSYDDARVIVRRNFEEFLGQ